MKKGITLILAFCSMVFFSLESSAQESGDAARIRAEIREHKVAVEKLKSKLYELEAPPQAMESPSSETGVLYGGESGEMEAGAGQGEGVKKPSLPMRPGMERREDMREAHSPKAQGIRPALQGGPAVPERLGDAGREGRYKRGNRFDDRNQGGVQGQNQGRYPGKQGKEFRSASPVKEGGQTVGGAKGPEGPEGVSNAGRPKGGAGHRGGGRRGR